VSGLKLSATHPVAIAVLAFSLQSVSASGDNPKDKDPLPLPTIDSDDISVRGVDKTSGDVRWILPGLRRLDPKVFGTPDAPLGFEPDVGVPVAARLTNTDGTAFTTTAGPTPFSDNFAIVSGDFKLKAQDKTLADDPASKDKLKFDASVTSPGGAINYEIKVSQILPVGVDHPVFGGVGTNMIHHGMTGIGTKLQPTQPTLVAIWGIGTLKVNGVVPDGGENRLVHSMVTCHVRNNPDYSLAFDDDVDCSRFHTHLMLPPVQVVFDNSGNPIEIDSPVPTGFVLPNGVEQPFLHVMFENTVIEDSDDQ
jgi:hypothetical protein